jgi:glycosyltransferase 2 family protein
MRAKIKSVTIGIAKVGVGLALLGMVIYLADPQKLWVGIRDANRWHLMLSILLVFASYLVGVVRWQLLSRSLGIYNVGFWQFLVLHFLGIFCNNFLPTGIGGDVVKAYYLGKAGRQHESYLSVMLDRYVGLLVLLLVAALVSLLQPAEGFYRQLAYASWGILILFVGGGLGTLLGTDILTKLLNRYGKEALGNKIKEINLLMRGLITNYPTLLKALGLSIFSQAFIILAVYELSLAAGAQTSAVAMFIIVPLVLLVNALPISIGGLGTRELAFVYLLSQVYLLAGMDQNTARNAAAVVAVLWLVVMLFTSLPGAAGYSFISRLSSEG